MSKDGVQGRHWLLKAPGLIFYLGVALAVCVGISASSIKSTSGLIGVATVWVLLAGIWAARLASAAMVSRMNMALREWLRWLAIPLILGSAYLWTQTGAPYDLRLSLSRAAMDRSAAEVMAGVTAGHDWIGLWPVEDLQSSPRGMRFIVSGSGFLDRWGFAYVRDGESPRAAFPGASEDHYDQLDGNWYIWTQGF